ncbi:hypothetical protein C6P40_000958 [Pichia californica]|uniref:Chromosome transmission fidelity protein 8 n=1 Tax=Pichia californica TaxID=460514 RepID=A0A9P7BI26_9ASCO|nr:hypothetical protein C6P42_002331 [[Candida] californica]KAG0690874.1 hypothetical protein C6P40_000958 [[Candida] californica]
MPSYDISFESAINSLHTKPKEKTLSDYSSIISTSLGLTIIEIQGDLSLPKDKPSGLNEKEIQLFNQFNLPSFLSDSNDPVDMVKFGRLEIDDSLKRATLFISTTQRLIGSIEKIDPPLGLLKVSSSNDLDHNKSEKNCQMIDIINTKIIFKNRPLPIM